MDGAVLTGFIGIAVLVIINIAIAAFSYGKLSQKVSDSCDRLKSMEDRVTKTEGRLTKVEGIVVTGGKNQ